MTDYKVVFTLKNGTTKEVEVSAWTINEATTIAFDRFTDSIGITSMEEFHKRVAKSTIITLSSKVMDELRKKIRTLTMTPADWSELDKRVWADDYRRIVNDYQKREKALRPTCNSAFGLCRYYDHGICGCKDSCGFKMYPPKD